MEKRHDRPVRFGAWLESQLLRREWSKSDLARRMGVEPTVVSRWVLGQRLPNPRKVEDIADALDVDVDEVLVIAGHRPRPPRDEQERFLSAVWPYVAKLGDDHRAVVIALAKTLADTVTEHPEQGRNGGTAPGSGRPIGGRQRDR